MRLKKQIIRYSFEFLVIVLGISVSFWINEWDKSRSNNAQYVKDLKSIQNDLKNDSIMFAKVKYQLDRGKLKINTLINEIELYQNKQIDYNEFSSRMIKIGFLYDNQTFFMTDATFKSLISSNRIDLFSDNLHSLMNDYYESIRKRITDNNQMVDNTSIKYYQEYHPFSLYYANAIIDEGYSEFKARITEVDSLDETLINRFKKYFKKSEIIKIYSTEKFLNHTSSLKNRIYKYDNQIKIFADKRKVIAIKINESIKASKKWLEISCRKSARNNNEYFEVNEPKFSICLTGTNEQVGRLITSTEDGLFSRFLFYSFATEFKWKNTLMDIEPTKQIYFDKLNAKICDLLSQSRQRRFRLKESQIDAFNTCFEDLSKSINKSYPEALDQLKRAGLKVYKLAMTLSGFRYSKEDFVCNDDDFNFALNVVTKVYLPHQINVMRRIYSKTKNLSSVEYLLDTLPIDFNRGNISEIYSSTTNPPSDKTISNYINLLIKQGKIIRVSQGKYKKRL